MITVHTLRQFAREWLKDTYQMDLEIPLEINARLKTTYGCFRYTIVKATGGTKPKAIHLNKFFVENNNLESVVDVLKHELVHYALFMQGKPHSDGDYYFEKELKRLNVVSQETINKKYDIKSKKIKKTVHLYKCMECDKTHTRGRALSNGGRYHQCICGGKLLDRGKQVVC